MAKNQGGFDQNNNQAGADRQVRPVMAITNLAIVALIVLTFLFAAFLWIFGLGDVGIQVLLPGGPLFIVAWAYALDRLLRLRTASYTIGVDSISSRTGTFSKHERVIPIGYVRDISSKVGPIQWLFGISDVRVTVTNGDSIVMTNIRNAEEYKAVLRSLVISYGPQRRTISSS